MGDSAIEVGQQHGMPIGEIVLDGRFRHIQVISHELDPTMVRSHKLVPRLVGRLHCCDNGRNRALGKKLRGRFIYIVLPILHKTPKGNRSEEVFPPSQEHVSQEIPISKEVLISCTYCFDADFNPLLLG
jgi:hypothetical protein